VARHASSSSLAEELIDEGLRVRRHPLIFFRDGATARRAALVSGPDVWEAVSGIVGGDVPAADRTGRAIELFGLRPEQVAGLALLLVLGREKSGPFVDLRHAAGGTTTRGEPVAIAEPSRMAIAVGDGTTVVASSRSARVL
jgi:hypothetical protein